MSQGEKSPTFKEFRSFVAANGDGVKQFVYRRVEREAVDDVVFATFELAGQKWARLPSLKYKQQLRLLRYAHRTIAKDYRHHRVHRLFIDGDETSSRSSGLDSSAGADGVEDGNGDDEKDADNQMVRAFNRLSYSEQDFLAFIAWDGLTPGDAARILNLSLGAFTLRLSKARTQLGRRCRREQRRSDARVSNKKFSDLWRRRAESKRLNDIDQLRPLDPVGELRDNPLRLNTDQVARDVIGH